MFGSNDSNIGPNFWFPPRLLLESTLSHTLAQHRSVFHLLTLSMSLLLHHWQVYCTNVVGSPCSTGLVFFWLFRAIAVVATPELLYTPVSLAFSLISHTTQAKQGWTRYTDLYPLLCTVAIAPQLSISYALDP